jgi:hypothetical protein
MLSEVHGRRDRLGNEVDLDGAVAIAPSSASPSPKQTQLSSNRYDLFLFSPRD